MVQPPQSSIGRCIRFFERVMRVDLGYIARGSFWLWGQHFVSIILGIALTTAFARFAEKSLYGQYQYILALVSTFSILALPGVNAAFSQAVVRGYEGGFYHAFWARARFSLLGSILFWGFSLFLYLFRPENHDLIPALVVAGLFFPCHYIFTTVFAYYQAKKKFEIPSLFQFAARLLSVGGVIGVLFSSGKLFWILCAYFISNTVVNLVGYVYFRRTQALNTHRDPDMIPFGKKLTLLSSVSSLTNSFDQLLIPSVLNFAELANYVIAIKIPDSIKNFFNLWDNLFFPKFVTLSKSQFIQKIKNPWIWAWWVACIWILGALLPAGILFLFGPSYRHVILIGQIYAWAIPPRIMQRTMGNWATAKKASRLYFHFSTTLRIMDVGLTTVIFFLIPHIGALAVTRVVMAYLTAAASFLLLRKASIE